MSDNRVLTKKGRPQHHGVDAVLAKLFRQISASVSQPNIIKAITQYLLKRKKYITTRELSSARGNIQKELDSPKMTWKVFCRMIEILGIKKFHIHIDVEWPHGTTTRYSRSIILSTEDTDGSPHQGSESDS